MKAERTVNKGKHMINSKMPFGDSLIIKIVRPINEQEEHTEGDYERDYAQDAATAGEPSGTQSHKDAKSFNT